MMTKNDWSRDIVDREVDWTELVKKTIWILGDEVTVSVI